MIDMCLMCVEVQKGSMKASEVGKALVEFKVPEGHDLELSRVIDDQGRKYSEEVYEHLFLENLRRMAKKNPEQLAEIVSNNTFEHWDEYVGGMDDES